MGQTCGHKSPTNFSVDAVAAQPKFAVLDEMTDVMPVIRQICSGKRTNGTESSSEARKISSLAIRDFPSFRAIPKLGRPLPRIVFEYDVMQLRPLKYLVTRRSLARDKRPSAPTLRFVLRSASPIPMRNDHDQESR
jgi:hypothetical protein